MPAKPRRQFAQQSYCEDEGPKGAARRNEPTAESNEPNIQPRKGAPQTQTVAPSSHARHLRTPSRNRRARYRRACFMTSSAVAGPTVSAGGAKMSSMGTWGHRLGLWGSFSWLDVGFIALGSGLISSCGPFGALVFAIALLGELSAWFCRHKWPWRKLLRLYLRRWSAWVFGRPRRDLRLHDRPSAGEELRKTLPLRIRRRMRRGVHLWGPRRKKSDIDSGVVRKRGHALRIHVGNGLAVCQNTRLQSCWVH